jgi:hypothetical protein
MRLPAKFIPQHSLRVAIVVGAAIFAVFAFAFLNSYLPTTAPAKGETFGHWLTGGDRMQLSLLILAFAILLFGLAVLAITLIDLLTGSPFNFLIIDRFGIRLHRIFGETRLSWKDLGPIRALHLGPLNGSRRYWIVSDTFSGEDRNDARRPLSSFTLRIPATAYLGRGWFSGGVDAAVDVAAAWLEALRQSAREDTLDVDNVPDAPEELGPAVPLAQPDNALTPEGSDLPAMADRKFGRRDGSTIER